MSDSLFPENWRITGRRSLRETNSHVSCENMGTDTFNVKYNYSQSSNNLNMSDDYTEKFSSKTIKTASTPYAPKSASYSEGLYPSSDLNNITNDKLEDAYLYDLKPTTTSNTNLEECIRDNNFSFTSYSHDLDNPGYQSVRTQFTSSRTSHQEEGSSMNVTMILSVLVISILCAVGYTWYADAKTKFIDIKNLHEKFPKQPNETWEYFETVIDDILTLNPSHPAVFLLLYTKENKQVNNLVHHVAQYASTKLETSENYISINKDEFLRTEAVEDYGYIIDKYEQDLINKKVMVVKDLQDIPGKVAQAFHTLCDEISPLVEKVVYIFTLKVDSVQGKAENIAERYLKRFWSDLDNDVLMPLITRVTSTVLKILN